MSVLTDVARGLFGGARRAARFTSVAARVMGPPLGGAAAGTAMGLGRAAYGTAVGMGSVAMATAEGAARLMTRGMPGQGPRRYLASGPNGEMVPELAPALVRRMTGLLFAGGVAAGGVAYARGEWAGRRNFVENVAAAGMAGQPGMAPRATIDRLSGYSPMTAPPLGADPSLGARGDMVFSMHAMSQGRLRG